MMIIFNLLQTIGYYGFASWVPTLLVSQGITVTKTLAYSFVVACAAPVGPFLRTFVADKIDRKWLLGGVVHRPRGIRRDLLAADDRVRDHDRSAS